MNDTFFMGWQCQTDFSALS